MMSFLIIQTAFIGDVILATAVAERIHRTHPDARIDIVVRKGNEAVLAGHPFIHRVYVWDKRSKYRDLWRMIREIRKTTYKVVVNLQRFTASGIMTLAARAEERVGFDKNPLSAGFTRRYPHRMGTASDPGPHEVDRCLALVDSFTGPGRDMPRLYPTTSDEERVALLCDRPYITCSPASVWFTKQWPAAKWVELIRAMPSQYRIYLLGAPSDRALCDRLAAECRDRDVHVLAGELSLLQSAALMRGADMNYTNDSAPLHLCSAVNAPVSAIFCSTIPAFGFGPLSAVSYCMEVSGDLPCRPCGVHGHRACPEGHFKCSEVSLSLLLQVLPKP